MPADGLAVIGLAGMFLDILKSVIAEVSTFPVVGVGHVLRRILFCADLCVLHVLRGGPRTP